VVPPVVGGGDLIPESARPGLVHRPAPNARLVVKARPGPGARVEKPHAPTVITGGGLVLKVAPGNLNGDRKGRVIVADVGGMQAGVTDVGVSVSRTRSATAARVVRWSRSGMKEMVVLTGLPVAVPSGCTVSDSSPAGL
jgi:hypothetical protein